MDSDQHSGYQAVRSGQRPCWLEVDLDAVAANVRALRQLVGPTTQLCAVVKAEAYGLGGPAISRAALEAGADRLAVARVEEGVALRRAGLTAPILLAAGFVQSESEEIVRHRLTPTIVQVEDALAVGRAAGRAGEVVSVHVKMDSGLTRFGASPTEALNLARLVENLPTLHLEGVYTHFATADEPDPTFRRQQLARFRAALDALGSEGIRPPLVHAANSAAALAEPSARLDMVRVGITLSGHYPSASVPRAVELKPAAALRATVLRLYNLSPGSSIGYGRTFFAERPMRVALVPAGYADGVPRAHSNLASALLRGARAPIVGRVSMDQCVVDVTRMGHVELGDEVTLFGESEGEPIGLDEFAAWSDTIVHEALCRVGPRVPRLYRQQGREWWWPGERVPERLESGAAFERWPSPS